jgi:hypothetical protein
MRRIQKALKAASNAQSEWAVKYWTGVAEDLRRKLLH